MWHPKRRRLSEGNGNFPRPALLSGVLVGVDFGLKRVGLAICDPEGRVAVGGGRIEGLHGGALTLAVVAAARIRGAQGIVVGEPALTRGNESVIKGALRLGKALQDEGFEVAIWPESYTTAAAHAARRHYGGVSRTGKGWVDEAAAVVLLQDYLEWRRSQAEQMAD